MVSSGRMRMPSCCATSQIAFQRTVESEISEPIQEDYGWGLWASRGKDRFWIAFSYVGDGPQEEPAQWVISVDLVKRLFHKPDPHALGQLRDRVRQILTSNSAIKTVEA